MKSIWMSCFLALLLILVTSSAYAFHDKGVAYCQGCHTMHNSINGAPVDTTGGDHGHAYLLNYGNSSDTCLHCHAGYGQFDGGAGFGPGGDFYWLTRTYTWTSHGHQTTSTGDSHGHNIVSPAYGLTVDQTLTKAPGGNFQAQYLTCTSCHDPHGNQNFRLLYDNTSAGPIYDGTRYNFTYPAPLAAGNARTTYVGGGGNETNSQHTVYKNGMSDWCSNCHAGFESSHTTNFVHPEQALGSDVAAAYNAYISSDNPTGGNPATSYWGLVPFEAVEVDLSKVNPANYTQGPTGVDQVMCVSCHRAHATAFAELGRWDFATEFMVDSHPQPTDGGIGPNDVAYKYYQYTFINDQRSLCNKCHLKDLGDGPHP